MRKPRYVYFGKTGQSIAHRCVQGRPSAATFAVYAGDADDTATAEFTGTSTIDSVSTTVDAASGRLESDPRKVSLAATTGIVIGGIYLLTSTTLEAEWVEVVEVASGDYVRVRDLLQNDYATSSTFVSTVASSAIDSTWAATLAKLSSSRNPRPQWRLRLDLTIGGLPYVEYDEFDLVRATVETSVTLDDVNVRWGGGLLAAMPEEYRQDGGKRLLDIAWASLRADLAKIDLDIVGARDAALIEEAHVLKALAVLGMGGIAPGGMDRTLYMAEARGTYERFFEANFGAALKAAWSGGGAEATTQHSTPYWRK